MAFDGTVYRRERILINLNLNGNAKKNLLQHKQPPLKLKKKTRNNGENELEIVSRLWLGATFATSL